MKKTTRNYVWILIANALLIAVIAVIWSFRLEHPAFGADAAPITSMAQPLPDATYKRNFDQDANLADLKGQWTVLNFWASWCPGCVAEMPSLEALAKEYKNNNLQVIAIAFDAKNSADLRQKLKRLHFGSVASNWDDQSAIYKVFNPGYFPTTYIVDPKGVIRLRVVGERDWTSPDSRKLIDDLMKTESQPAAGTESL